MLDINVNIVLGKMSGMKGALKLVPSTGDCSEESRIRCSTSESQHLEI